MAKFINKTPGTLYFGRFKVKSGEAVPAVEYTDVELTDIERFVSKGVLVSDDAPVAVETEKPAETPVVVEEGTEQEASVEVKNTKKK